MSVCLTKPFKGFEFTPVHICDEVYPNSILQERKSVLRFCPLLTLTGAVSVSRKPEERFPLRYSAHCEIRFFFSKEPVDVANIAIVNDEIVYGYRDNPLAEPKNFKHSKLLNSLRDMFVCIESDSATIESFCDFLVNGWGSILRNIMSVLSRCEGRKLLGD